MANEQEAGAIIIALKAQIDSLQKGVETAKATLKGFGQETEKTSQQTQKGGERIGATFDGMDKQSVRLAARMSLLSVRLLGLQTVMQTFGARMGGDGAAPKVFRAVGDSLTAFAGIVSVMPNKFGLAAGATAALGVGLANMIGPSEKLKDALAKVNGELDRLRGQRADLEKAATRFGLEQKIRGELGLPTAPRIDVLRSEQERLVQKLASLQQELDTLVLDPTLLAGGQTLDGKTLAGLRAEIEGTRKAIKALTPELKALEEGAKTGVAIDALTAKVKELTTASEGVKIKLGSGIISPLQAAQEELRLTEQAIEALIAAKETLGPETFNEQLQGLLETLQKDRGKLNVILNQQAVERELNRQAENFGGALGDAVFHGVLEGRKGMEIVADAGRNLFANFMGDAVKQFQDGMVSAFKAIAGEGGAALGGMFTALVGIAGGIFANRRSKSSESFTGVRSQVESSQALRGIVAGPSNVAIAAVGEDLARAVQPVVDGIRVLASIMSKVEANTRRGGGGGGGGGFDAVGVATP